MKRVVQQRFIDHGIIAVVRYEGMYMVETWDEITEELSILDYYEFSSRNEDIVALQLAERYFVGLERISDNQIQ